MKTNLLTKSLPEVSEDIAWQFINTTDISPNELIDLAISIGKIADDGFGMDMDFDVDHAKVSILSSDVVCLLHSSKEKKLCGFALLRMAKLQPSKTLIYLSKICFCKTMIGKKCGKKLMTLVIDRFNPAVISAMTQNPAVLHLLSSNALLSFPFTADYTSKLGASIVDSMIANDFMSLADIANFDDLTGIIKNKYGHRLGDYPSTDIDEYNTLNRDNGDSYLISSLYQI
ncbi:MAG: hypothetical protein IPL55_10010 [Saprospiraceae bacterium]|nr:hypothetical protein [Saprospiraceae bacterium]